MKIKKIILIAKLLGVTIICFSQSAKRGAPKPVTPIIVDSIEYSAPDREMDYCIVARNIKTDSIIWKKRIYKIHYIKDLEQDVQWVFIDSIKIKNKNLLIRTEKDKYYKLNLETLEVSDIDKKDFINR